jgi:hypothetical protein
VNAVPVVLGPTVNPTAFVPTSPGFIGLQRITSTLGSLTAGSAFGDYDTGLHSGQIFRAGYWFDSAHTSGIEADGLIVESTSGTIFQSNAQNLAVPVLNPATGQVTNRMITQNPITATNITNINTTPAVFVHLQTETITDYSTGGINVSSSSGLFSTGADYRQRVVNFGGGSRLDFLGGWRVASLNESLTLGTSSTGAVNDITNSDLALGLPPPLNGSVANITNFSTVTSDTFSTKNLFTGPEVGVGGKYRWGAFSLSGDAKLAIGANFEQLSISGNATSTTITSTTPTQVVPLAGIPLTVPSGAPAVNTAATSRTPGGLFIAPVATAGSPRPG